eukprot:gene14350-15846_t
MSKDNNERSAGQHIEWHELDKKRFYLIGPSLFFFVRMVIYPPILIKTRLQLQKKKSLYKGTFDAFSKIYKYEGVRGFYKGFITSSFTILSGQIYVTSYEIIRTKTQGHSNFTRGLIAGGCASIAAQTITVPVDVISQKQMIQGQNAAIKETISTITKSSVGQTEHASKKFVGPIEIISGIWKESGPRGFYRGYLASLMTYAPSSSIWWASYGMFTGLLSDFLPEETPKVFVQAMSGPLAGITAAIFTNPLDIVRTRLQIEGGTSIIRTASLLYSEEGIRAVYKGLSARILSTLPTSLIIIIGYETVKRLSLKKNSPSDSE